MPPPVPETLAVPCRPAVAKYLRRTLHLAPGQAFRLTKKDKAGRLLYHLLRNPQQDRQYDAGVAAYPERFLVHVSQQMSWLSGCRHLTSQAVHDFNRHVEDLIELEFITMVTTLSAFGIVFETKQAALSFLALNGFTDEDYTFAALVQMYYRYRKAQKTAQKAMATAAQPYNYIPNCPAQLAQAL